MNVIPLKEATPGMILARPVEDALGRVLINAGETLTAELIKVLMRRGFSDVEIKPQMKTGPSDTTIAPRSEPTEEPGSEDRYFQELDRLKVAYKDRFSGVDTADDAMQTIMRTTLRVLIDELTAKYRPARQE